MKCIFRVMGALLLLLAVVVRAEGPDDQYVVIYTLMQDADALNAAGQGQQALAKYREAQTALARFPTAYPGWNEKVVSYRMNYLASKLAPLVAKFGANAGAAPIPGTAETTAPKVAGAETNAALRDLQDEMRRLQADNTTLAVKLKEALSVQPPSVDPREIAKAEEKNKVLQKENELLRVSLTQEQAKSAKMVDPEVLAEATRALGESKSKLEVQTQTLSTLKTENDLLKKQADEMEKKQSGVAQDLNKQLQETRVSLAALQTLNDKMRSEKDTLEKRVAELTKQAGKRGDVDSQLAAAKSAAKENEQAVSKLQKEKADLESKLSKTVAEAVKAEAGKRKQLESEVESLKSKLDKAEKQLAKRSSTKGGSSDAQKELAALQAQVKVLEAKPSPYSTEELAALKKPEVQLVATAPETTPVAPVPPVTVAEVKPAVETKPIVKRTVRELPAGAGAMAAAAQRAFAAKKFDEAEAKYLDILRQDEKNVFTLGNVAAIQIEMNKLDQAEKNLTTALGVDAQDDFCLYLMGRVKFQRGKMDEALKLLSQAAQSNPDSAETQNYLGIVLSEKGMRLQAEAAFRKAIQMQPGYAAAHNNLAFIYASQKPPVLALARWHYQKALANGHPKNPDLEKLLGENK